MKLGGLVLFLALAASARAGYLLDFPTPNRALLNGPSGAFYMYVDRDFEGRRSQPWQGGQFGYVRGPHRVGGEIVFSQLHEGIDIKPTRRDAEGNPLDTVSAAANGTVVYVNARPGGSNYGRYVVIEHRIEGSPYYTLYAHLAEALVKAGDPVTQGQPIGKMGFSGAGIDRTRAHTHFEFTLMLSPNFDAWLSRIMPGEANPHGACNGRNLSGIDPAALLLAVRKNPAAFSLRDYLRGQEAYFKVVIPTSAHLELLRLYPWMIDAKGATSPPPAWTISFTRYGTPIRAEPYPQPVAEPFVAWVQPSKISNSMATRGLVVGTAARPALSVAGRQLMALLAAPPAAAPAP